MGKEDGRNFGFGGKEMIECPTCHLEYRGSIPKFCMECGTKLPEEEKK
jgi:hypothetical protein